MKDYYEILKLTPQSTPAEVKAAFRMLSKKYHPDLHQGDKFYEEQFKNIQEAYAVLKDSEKRKSYDKKLEKLKESSHGYDNGPVVTQASRTASSKFTQTRKRKSFKASRKTKIMAIAGVAFVVALTVFLSHLENNIESKNTGLDSIEPTITTPSTDSLNLLEGYKGDSAYNNLLLNNPNIR